MSGHHQKDAADNVARYLGEFGVPNKYLYASFDWYKPKTKKQYEAKEYLMSINGTPRYTMFITGIPGTGKTHLAISFMRVMVLHRRKCRFVTSSELFAALKKAIADHENEYYILLRYRSPNLVVFDDIGAERVTDYARSIWYQIVDHRYREQYPTIYTSNLTLDQIADAYDDRIASRLSSGKVLYLDGNDHRATIGGAF